MSCPIKIVATGRFEDCVGGKTEVYKIEPHQCPQCGKMTDEFASHYIGRKAAEFMVQLASREGYKCCLCLFAEARQEAKRHLFNK